MVIFGLFCCTWDQEYYDTRHSNSVKNYLQKLFLTKKPFVLDVILPHFFGLEKTSIFYQEVIFGQNGPMFSENYEKKYKYLKLNILCSKLLK